TKPRVQVWSLPFDGGTPTLLGDGDNPVIHPDGEQVAFVRQGQVYQSAIDGSTKSKQLFYARGSISGLQWSPDGQSLAFVSSRGSHSLIGIYREGVDTIQWIAPSFSRDASVRWSPEIGRASGRGKLVVPAPTRSDMQTPLTAATGVAR